MKHVTELHGGETVPSIGQGTWFLGENKSRMEEEGRALRTGIEAGMTLIDTAEMYGDGKAETLVGNAIRMYERERLFLVSKVYPHNAGTHKIFTSCENSLRRMGTEYLDLYLLHWRGRVPLAETVECMERLVRMGKIRRWGVSNFDVSDMEELFSVPGGENCAANQVLYHLGSRGVEYDLLPWLRGHGVPMMAYCPLAQGGDLKQALYENPVIRETAARHGCTAAQLLLAFVLRQDGVMAIPRSGNPSHTMENAQADSLLISEAEWAAVDREFPAPKEKVRLDIV